MMDEEQSIVISPRSDDDEPEPVVVKPEPIEEKKDEPAVVEPEPIKEEKKKRVYKKKKKERTPEEIQDGHNRRLEGLKLAQKKALEVRARDKQRLKQLNDFDTTLSKHMTEFKLEMDKRDKMILKKFEEFKLEHFTPANKKIINKLKTEEINPALVGLEPEKKMNKFKNISKFKY